MQYHHVRTISGKGSRPDQFAESLKGIATDPAGLVYAVGDREVKVFDSNGELQRRWRTNQAVYCVAIDERANVFVGEAGQVEKFNESGGLLATWHDEERLGAVTAIGFFGDSVLIADARGRCIRQYDGTGQWLKDIGKDNNTRGFLIPNGYLDFAIDGAGIIHACNPAKHRVERYSMAGELLGHFGRFGTRRPEDFPGCCNPSNLALTKDGHIVVTEKAAPRMKVYDAAGHLVALVEPKFFDANCKNMDVATDAQGRIYVVDTVRLNILVFVPDMVESEAVERPESPAPRGVDEP